MRLAGLKVIGVCALVLVSNFHLAGQSGAKKVTPIIIWLPLEPIPVGSPLSDKQLNAIALVAGTFAYDPPAGTILPIGNDHPLTTDFTPDDLEKYKIVSNARNKITIIPKLDPEVKWDHPQDITYGTPLGPDELDATANMPGTFVYTPNTGAILDAGNQPLSVTFTPIDTIFFNSITKSVDIKVKKVVLTSQADNKSRKYGQPNPEFTITYSGFVNGETAAVLDTPPIAGTTATSSSPEGTYPISLAPGQDDNYNFTYTKGTLTIVGGLAPTISNFQIGTDEDTDYPFEYKIFHQNFSGSPGDSVASVRIVQPPQHGKLSWKGTKLTPGDDVSVSNGQLEKFLYQPSPDFNGRDTIIYNVSDGTQPAQANALIIVYVLPVNDPPMLSFVGPGVLTYSTGDPPLAVAGNVILEDSDDEIMLGAQVVIGENHVLGDLLAVDGFSSPGVSASYNESQGIMTLSGSDSKSKYEEILRHVVFSSPASSEASTSTRTLTLSVTDGKDTGTPLTRHVILSNYPEVGIVNAFTPNQDGVNDFWDFVNLDAYKEVKITVFDQNGVRVFDCVDPGCQWDGRINGKELPPGPYFFNIDLATGGKTYRGTVTILR